MAEFSDAAGVSPSPPPRRNPSVAARKAPPPGVGEVEPVQILAATDHAHEVPWGVLEPGGNGR